MSIKKSLLSVLFILILAFSFSSPLLTHQAYADIATTTSSITPTNPQASFADSVETTFFGDVKDDGNGCSVFKILNLILDILSGAIAIAAVVGITVAGIQYMTSREHEEQATKAKRRIFEIVIGLVAYALLYVALSFVMPGGKMSISEGCKSKSNGSQSSINTSSTANQPTTQPSSTSPSSPQRGSAAVPSTSSQKNSATKASSITTSEAINLKNRTLINNMGLYFVLPYRKDGKTYYSKEEREKPAFKNAATTKKIVENEKKVNCSKYTGDKNYTCKWRQKGRACGIFVGSVIQASGVDPNMPASSRRIRQYVRGEGEYKNAGGNKNWKKVKNSEGKADDIILHVQNNEGKHVAMYLKDKSGNTVTAEASVHNHYGYITKKSRRYKDKKNSGSDHWETYRYIGANKVAGVNYN